MTCTCGARATHLIGVSPACYGCWLRDKDLAITGETVAGRPYGTPSRLLTDTAIDQRLEASKEIESMSQRMQAGGAVVEDALQAPIQQQHARAADAAAEANIIPRYGKGTMWQ